MRINTVAAQEFTGGHSPVYTHFIIIALPEWSVMAVNSHIYMLSS